MKNLGILLLISLAFAMGGCDYISDPFENTVPVNNGALCPDDSFPTSNPHRVVLLEDYTGHRCAACPQAALAAKKIEQQFGDSVILLSVHANYFATAYPPNYPENFKTTAGEAYDTKFGFTGWPNGLINRIEFPQNTHIKSYGSWATVVNQLLKTPVEADLQLTTQFNATDSMVCISAKAELLSNNLPFSTYKLCILLAQDNIIAPQLDGSVRIPEYNHKHVLRDNVTATWGDTLLTGTASLTPIVKKYQYRIKGDYNGINCSVKDCHIIAFIYDATTYRILQAKQRKIIP